MTIVAGSVTFGCDPEMFFTKGGQVIGAEKVLPKLRTASQFVLDGVQVELNPSPTTCRANLGNEIAECFRNLRNQLHNMKDVGVSFEAVITLDKDELESLSDQAKRFGCAPSHNLYDTTASVRADASKDLQRAAGGHIHLGLLYPIYNATEAQYYYASSPHVDHRERLVPILDTIIGNTCVMIDRNPLAAERRKHYGRAGEYRLPKHGLEYRTLSNFWLRSYPLMSFVMGLARMSVGVLYSTLMQEQIKKSYGNKAGWGEDLEKELLSSVDLEKIRTAINTNDLELAKENWKPVREFIDKHATTTTGDYAMGIPKEYMKYFDFFLKMIEEKGLEFWFPQNPLDNWCAMPEGHGKGWEAFLWNTVQERMRTNG